MFTMDTAQLFYLIVEGKRIDVAHIISTEMRAINESGKDFGGGVRSAHLFVFPGLIMGLLIASSVRIPSTVHFEIKIKVDDIYFRRYCVEKSKNKRKDGTDE